MKCIESALALRPSQFVPLIVEFQAHAPQHAFFPELSRLDLGHLYYHSRTSEPESDVALGGTRTASAADIKR